MDLSLLFLGIKVFEFEFELSLSLGAGGQFFFFFFFFSSSIAKVYPRSTLPSSRSLSDKALITCSLDPADHVRLKCMIASGPRPHSGVLFSAASSSSSSSASSRGGTRVHYRRSRHENPLFCEPKAGILPESSFADYRVPSGTFG